AGPPETRRRGWRTRRRARRRGRRARRTMRTRRAPARWRARRGHPRVGLPTHAPPPRRAPPDAPGPAAPRRAPSPPGPPPPEAPRRERARREPRAQVSALERRPPVHQRSGGRRWLSAAPSDESSITPRLWSRLGRKSTLPRATTPDDRIRSTATQERPSNEVA